MLNLGKYLWPSCALKDLVVEAEKFVILTWGHLCPLYVIDMADIVSFSFSMCLPKPHFMEFWKLLSVGSQLLVTLVEQGKVCLLLFHLLSWLASEMAIELWVMRAALPHHHFQRVAVKGAFLKQRAILQKSRWACLLIVDPSSLVTTVIMEVMGCRLFSCMVFCMSAVTKVTSEYRDEKVTNSVATALLVCISRRRIWENAQIVYCVASCLYHLFRWCPWQTHAWQPLSASPWALS